MGSRLVKYETYLKLALLVILNIRCNTWVQKYSRLFKIDLDRVIDCKEYSKIGYSKINGKAWYRAI